MGGGDPREWRRDVSERGGARVGLALAAEDRRIGRLDVTLVEARREAVGADRAEPDHRARQRDREREGQRPDAQPVVPVDEPDSFLVAGAAAEGVADGKSVEWGKEVSVRVDSGCCRISQKK